MSYRSLSFVEVAWSVSVARCRQLGTGACLGSKSYGFRLRSIVSRQTSEELSDSVDVALHTHLGNVALHDARLLFAAGP